MPGAYPLIVGFPCATSGRPREYGAQPRRSSGMAGIMSNEYADPILARAEHVDRCDECGRVLTDDELVRNCEENSEQDGNSMLCDECAMSVQVRLASMRPPNDPAPHIRDNQWQTLLHRDGDANRR
jgi:hypothetical protein